METQVKKWGNSLGLRIPRTIANQVNIRDGSMIYLELIENKIIITTRNSNEFNLSELLSQVNESNLHNEIYFGRNQCKEIW